MLQTKTKNTNRLFAVVIAIVMAVALLAGTAQTVKADSSTATYDAPTTPMSVEESIITGTAHRAASPILGMMGLNAVSGFGMINGAAPTDLASASKSAAVGIWGTSINDSPDPYYWNYFYNFYVDAHPELGLEKSDDALMNPSAAASPMQADTTLVEDYGNISVSLSTRPEVVIGTAAKGAQESDTHGYDDQLETIHGFTEASPYYHTGDERYDPALVAYTRATLVDMISSAKRIGAAMDDITDAANGAKLGRYADETGHSSYIADEYENFIYGLQAYIMSKIDTKKTVAIVSAANEDGTFTIADASTQEATSSNRYVEYTDIVGDNVAATLGTNITAEQLAAVDVIILSNFNSEGFTDASGQAVTFYELLKGQPTYNDSQIIIENYPSALYGITMNSVENAMGMAYITSYMYSDNAAVDLDPVSMCAYYYQKFYHISDINNLKEAIAINFANVTLPEGMSGTLSDSYDAAAIEQKINIGAEFYVENQDKFADTYIAKANWQPVVKHVQHTVSRVKAKDPTATEPGNIMYYICDICGKYFSDQEATNEISAEDVIIPAGQRDTLTYTFNGKSKTIDFNDEGFAALFDDAETWEGYLVASISEVADYLGLSTGNCSYLFADDTGYNIYSDADHALYIATASDNPGFSFRSYDADYNPGKFTSVSGLKYITGYDHKYQDHKCVNPISDGRSTTAACGEEGAFAVVNYEIGNFKVPISFDNEAVAALFTDSETYEGYLVAPLTEVLDVIAAETADCSYVGSASADGFTVYFDADDALYLATPVDNAGYSFKTYDKDLNPGRWTSISGLDSIKGVNHNYENGVCTNKINTGKTEYKECGAEEPVVPAAIVTKAPAAKSLQYTAKAQELVTAGTASGGTMQYSLDNKTFGTAIPTAVKAGTYTVYYKAAADASHTDSAVQSVKVTIAKAANTITAKAKSKTLSAKAKTKTTIKASKAFTVSNAQGKVTYKKSSGKNKITVASNGKITVKKGLKKGTYTVKVKVTAAGNANYNKATKTVTLKIKVK